MPNWPKSVAEYENHVATLFGRCAHVPLCLHAFDLVGSLFEKRSNIITFWVGRLKHFGCLQKMVEKLSESSEFEEFLKLVQEVAIKILSQISSIKT